MIFPHDFRKTLAPRLTLPLEERAGECTPRTGAARRFQAMIVPRLAAAQPIIFPRYAGLRRNAPLRRSAVRDRTSPVMDFTRGEMALSAYGRSETVPGYDPSMTRCAPHAWRPSARKCAHPAGRGCMTAARSHGSISPRTYGRSETVPGHDHPMTRCAPTPMRTTRRGAARSGIKILEPPPCRARGGDCRP
jgi:hypothetical protein